MLTLADLNNLNPSKRTLTVDVGGREVAVRGLTAAEFAEIDAVVPEPVPPLVEDKNGNKYRDDQDRTFVQKAEACDQRRLYVRAAVAMGYAPDKDGTPLPWNTEGIGGTPLPASARAPGPGLDRKTYADLVGKQLGTLGLAAIQKVRMASMAIESGTDGEHRGGNTDGGTPGN